MYVLGSGRRRCRGGGGEWMTGLGLNFTNPVGTGGCWTCVCALVGVV